jgi:hypothetical protein
MEIRLGRLEWNITTQKEEASNAVISSNYGVSVCGFSVLIYF